MKLVDIGINLTNHQFNDDHIEVLDRAYAQGIEYIILTSVDTHSFRKNISFCLEEYELNLVTTWGLHPHNAKNLNSFTKETISEFKHNISHIKAIGEFGLDFFRMISSQKEQENAMHYFLEIGSEYPKLPFFLHEREAHSSFCSIYKEHQSKLSNLSVVHCFTGNKTELRAYLDLGMYIGITGWICDERRGSDLQEALQYIPNDRLMIETDSPYLKPRTIKHKSIRNEPAFLPHILQKICELKQSNIEELGEIVYNNSVRFFNL